MRTQIVGSCRQSSLSLRRKFRPLLKVALGVVLVGVTSLTVGCEQGESCEYRCTAEQSACPASLACDVTLGYCVSEGYTGTCDAETHEVTVCKDEPVELELPDAAPLDPKEIDGLPSSAAIEGGKLKAQFSKKTVFAFGAPEEPRQFWHVDISDDCPVLEATIPQLCVGETLSRTLAVRGGQGNVAFALLEEDPNFTLSEDGVLAGKATVSGEHELTVAVTDERGLNTVRTVTLAVSNECPDIEGGLPDSCAGAQYEAELDLVGKAPVRVTDFTPIQKDGKDLTSAQARALVEQLGLEVFQSDDSYVLSAAPQLEALGSYLLALKLQNDLRIEQRNVPFEVKKCSSVQADFTACQGETWDFDLEGSPGDVWTFYDDQDPLNGPLSFVSDRRLRGKITTPGFYEIQARVANAVEETARLVDLTLAVLPTSDPACSEVDAGAADAGATETPPTTETDDAGSESTAPPQPQAPPHVMGCVGEWLSYRPQLDLPNANSWWLADPANLPTGLEIDAQTGRITGKPTSAGSGSFTVHAESPAGQRLRQHLFTISETCIYGFKTLNDADLTSLFLGHVLHESPNPTEVLPPVLLGQGDVDLFAFDRTGTKVALTSNDPSGPQSRGYVARIGDRDESGKVVVEVDSLPLFPFPTKVLELAWSGDGRLGMIVEGEGQSAAANRRLITFYTDTEGAWQVDIDDAMPSAQSLTWMGPYPCVASKYRIETESFNGVVCRTPDGQSVATQGPPDQFVSKTAIRASAGSLLAATPIVVDGAQPDPIYVAGLSTSSDPWTDIVYRGVFASPRGDMLAVARSDGSLELATVGSQTEFPDEGLYTPVGFVENCAVVTAWSPQTGALACSPEGDPVALAFATFNAGALANEFAATVDGHASGRQKAFVDDRFYVFDAGRGKLTIVSLQTTPKVSHIQVGANEPSLMALRPLPMAGSHSRLVVQSETSLVVFDLDAEAIESQVSAQSSGLPRVEDCVRTFGLSGFPNWCGGDETSRSFEVSHDAFHYLYLTSDGELHLSNSVGDAIIAATQCGSALNCSNSFKFAK